MVGWQTTGTSVRAAQALRSQARRRPKTSAETTMFVSKTARMVRCRSTLYLLLLAQVTASATSLSVRPSACNLRRTALADPGREGVRTRRSPSISTSKCEGLPSVSMTRLGRVSWFLAVTFASIRHSKEVRCSPASGLECLHHGYGCIRRVASQAS